MTERLAGAGFVFPSVGIIVDDGAGGAVFDHSVKGGTVIWAFLGDLKASCRSGVAFFSSGDGTHTDKLASFVEVGFLFREVDADAGGALEVIAVPVALGVGAFRLLIGVGKGVLGAESGKVARAISSGSGSSEATAGAEDEGEKAGEDEDEGFHDERKVRDVGGMARWGFHLRGEGGLV